MIRRTYRDGREVKVTMAYKITFTEIVEKRMANFVVDHDIYRSADHIVGTLLLLECLKQSSKQSPLHLNRNE